MLGEIALYTFIILLLTGIFLTLFFQPSMTEVVYHGSYTQLDGVRMSEAYASTLNISFDVRGGLLMRQIHHWAAILFVAAIMVHMLRIFFTGAFRKPREVNWLIGIVLFMLGPARGLFGYSLPDDLLSGTGLRITEGVLQSHPDRRHLHVVLPVRRRVPGHRHHPAAVHHARAADPGLLLALIAAHLFMMFYQKHTQMPGQGRTDKNVVGVPDVPVLHGQGRGVLLLRLRRHRARWPRSPRSTRSGCTAPTTRLGDLRRLAARLLHGLPRGLAADDARAGTGTSSAIPFAWNVFIPALVPLGLILTGAAL